MVIWTQGLYDLKEDYDWMEFFAGNAACTTYTRLQGHRGVKFDLKYNQHVPPGSINYMDINSPSGFVLAIVFILKGRVDQFVAWFGIKCSSWTQINTGTSARSPCASIGDTMRKSVAEANKMLERICLLVILVVCRGGCWILEQPNGSMLEFYPCFRWAIGQMIEIDGVKSVSRISWWMSKFGAATAKPQYAYSNSPSIRKVHRYESQPSKVKKDMKAKVQTCRKYTNKQGKECYVGTSELKDTEIYPDMFGYTISELVDDLRGKVYGCPRITKEISGY
ncbi:Uncharacterized protein SCF082_LOCUS41189 [Durusdinium trenchii]|uniref:Uncharacterized protein n=1 Tax=Durusdinium trenchii TaxID=1381693 RepID=A0ABP0QGH4_9DINO